MTCSQDSTYDKVAAVMGLAVTAEAIELGNRVRYAAGMENEVPALGAGIVCARAQRALRGGRR